MEPLQPQGPELLVSVAMLVVFAVTVFGGAIALRRELAAGRPIGGWLVAFLLLGPFGVAAYFARSARVPA